MTEALRARSRDERVLEIGTGSGYAAAVLAGVARRGLHDRAPRRARATARASGCARLGYANVARAARRRHARLARARAVRRDRRRGRRPGASRRPLLEQLAIGGRLVIPVGAEPRARSSCASRASATTEYQREDLGAVRFVPLIGAAGLAGARRGAGRARRAQPGRAAARPASRTLGCARRAEPIARHRRRDPIDALLERIGDARVVLLGEATHGTSEFYRMRARITQRADPAPRLHGRRRRGRLARRRARRPLRPRHRPRAAGAVDAVHAVPDLDVAQPRGRRRSSSGCARTTPSAERPSAASASHGLDLYSMYTSIAAVLRYLDRVDPRRRARWRARATAA